MFNEELEIVTFIKTLKTFYFAHLKSKVKKKLEFYLYILSILEFYLL